MTENEIISHIKWVDNIKKKNTLSGNTPIDTYLGKRKNHDFAEEYKIQKKICNKYIFSKLKCNILF